MADRLRYGLSWLVLFLVLSAWPLPARARSLDLLACYRLAVASDPLLRGAEARLQAARAGEPLAKAALKPKLSLASGLARRHARVSGMTPAEIEDTLWADQYSLTLTQPLFDGQALANLAAARSFTREEEALVAAARQELVRRLCHDYFEVLRSEAAFRVAGKRRQLMAELAARSQTALAAGLGDRIDFRQARAEADAAEAGLIRAGNQRAIARRELETLIHAPAGPLADLEELEPQGPKPATVAPWLAAALTNQPLLEKARQRLRVARQQVERERRRRWPRLDLKAQAAYLKGELLPGTISRDAEAGLFVSVPLYLGGSITAATRQALAAARVAEQELAHRRDQVRLDTRRAFLGLVDSVVALKAARLAMESARLAMVATRKGYELGTRTMLDALATVEKYHDARRKYFSALYGHLLARIELKAAAGVLSAQDVTAVNALLVAGRSEQGSRR